MMKRDYDILDIAHFFECSYSAAQNRVRKSYAPKDRYGRYRWNRKQFLEVIKLLKKTRIGLRNKRSERALEAVHRRLAEHKHTRARRSSTENRA